MTSFFEPFEAWGDCAGQHQLFSSAILIVLERIVGRSNHLQLLGHVGSHKLSAQELEPVNIFDWTGRHEFGLFEAVQIERQELQRVRHEESVVADDLLRLFAEAVDQSRDRVG